MSHTDYIVKDMSLAVGHGKLGSPAKINRAGHLAVCRGNHGHAVASSIEGKNLGRSRVEDDAVRLFPCRYLADRLERLQIEYRYCRCLTVADKATAQLRHEGNSVDTKCVGYLANDGSRIHVQHFDLSPMGDVESPGSFIHDQVVPTTLPWDGNFLDDAIVPISKGEGRKRYQ